ncbi:hypothetical protein RintRC_0009 [Richelia intracellularis]|nr:hypothetical protein RintRC_0009 [Richelia intracellularis]
MTIAIALSAKVLNFKDYFANISSGHFKSIWEKIGIPLSSCFSLCYTQ